MKKESEITVELLAFVLFLLRKMENNEANKMVERSLPKSLSAFPGILKSQGLRPES